MPDAIVTGRKCTAVEQTEDGVIANFVDTEGRAVEPFSARIAIGCDGLHSALRKQFFPDEGEPRYSGINMW